MSSAVAIDSSDATFECELPARPYPGLRPFEKREWPIFFGRERMADEVVARLVKQRLLVVHGDSGCGKSSLIYAGVLPRLEQEAARGGARWRTCAAAPGENPLWNLAQALAGLTAGSNQDELSLELRRALNFGRDGARALSDILRRGEDDHICILVDQFEELFAHAKRSSPHDARLLTEFLIGIKEQRVDGVYAVLTMRSEFLGACAQYFGFAEAVNATQYLLPRMEHADLIRAIREPATLYDGAIDLELAERLILDVGSSPDELPLIQHGLMLLYEEQVLQGLAPPPPGWRLGLEHYARGNKGLEELLSDHADEVAVLAGAHVSNQRYVEDMFRALTDINAEGQAIRRPQRLKQLIAVTGAPEAVLRKTVDAFRADGVSLLRPYGSGELSVDDRVDISHEALIRGWRRIADPYDGWLQAEFKNGLVWRSLLVQADSFAKDSKNLLSPATADERALWLKRRNAAWCERYGGGWERVVQLVKASLADRDRRDRKRRLQVVLLVLLVVLCAGAAAVAVVFNVARNDADRAREAERAAREKADRLGASERAARQEAETSRADLQTALEKEKAAQAALTSAKENLQLSIALKNKLLQLFPDVKGIEFQRSTFTGTWRPATSGPDGKKNFYFTVSPKLDTVPNSRELSAVTYNVMGRRGGQILQTALPPHFSIFYTGYGCFENGFAIFDYKDGSAIATRLNICKAVGIQ